VEELVDSRTHGGMADVLNWPLAPRQRACEVVMNCLPHHQTLTVMIACRLNEMLFALAYTFVAAWYKQGHAYVHGEAACT
jgi:hypothetical protein